MLYTTAKPVERALLVGLIECEQDYASLKELEKLAQSAGAEVCGSLFQKAEPCSATLFGKGKVEEFKKFIEINEITLLICDNVLSGSQVRNLTELLDIKVIDRASLILDIFAMRASTLEGKLQVELAQLKYNLPRLVGVSGRMAKYNAGIGSRGPGEKKLETDKRIIREQIDDLSHKISKLTSERDLRREKRIHNNQKTVSLVGYTNAGKSSIMNHLAKSDCLEEDKLFATLDPITRKVHTDRGNFLLTDTVGFINKLPHEFISAFASTLEEARLADILLIVMDISSDDLFNHFKVVSETLEKLDIINRQVITVYNKCDLKKVESFKPSIINSIEVSAKTGEGMEELKNRIMDMLFPNQQETQDN